MDVDSYGAKSVELLISASLEKLLGSSSDADVKDYLNGKLPK